MAFLAAIPVAYIAAATAAASVASAIAAASAQHASAESAEKAAQYNAQLNEQKAVVATQQATANADQSSRQSDLALGTALAAGSQNGTGLGGSTGALYEQDATNAELTAMNIRYGGQMQAAALESGAQLDTYQASVDSSNASSATTSGIIGAGAGALNAVGSYANTNARLGYYGTRYGGAFSSPAGGLSQ
ncbi:MULTISPECIES: hypothetical protein [Paraburkholderia]|uniref:hypothetical protein n=1 Tax=Paraburkholderia TaxID=1822464 RepID=UPI0022561F3E|nr:MULTISPECIES: hypothetical protein [Paraburkholderia]MCX4154999.1 hypothetical protein [Paraburkholderia aspalathi]MDN7164409.1 hypothetical protein [Paraburkholderia sp. SECH2]MDQ6392894.1 hypothetical protein [Paraburkholderia aspalathi]